VYIAMAGDKKCKNQIKIGPGRILYDCCILLLISF